MSIAGRHSLRRPKVAQITPVVVEGEEFASIVSLWLKHAIHKTMLVIEGTGKALVDEWCISVAGDGPEFGVDGGINFALKRMILDLKAHDLLY